MILCDGNFELCAYGMDLVHNREPVRSRVSIAYVYYVYMYICIYRPLYVIKVDIFLYSAVSSTLDRSKRFTLFALPGTPVHSDTNSASPGSILAMQQYECAYL